MAEKELTLKQRTELTAAVRFIKSIGLPIDYSADFSFPPEADTVDVIYIPQKINFQVTSVEGGPNRLIRQGSYNWSDKLDEIIDKYILEPTKKKYERYRG